MITRATLNKQPKIFLKKIKFCYRVLFSVAAKVAVSNFHGGNYETFCAIWYHLRKLKNMKNTHGEMLLSGFCLQLY